MNRLFEPVFAYDLQLQTREQMKGKSTFCSNFIFLFC